MADEAEDDVLELEEDQLIDDEQGEDQADQTDVANGDEGEEETVISFGDDEAAPASGDGDTPLIKHLRAQLRERDKQLAEARKSAPPPVELGPKPTLESCDYDEQAFEQRLDEWKERKATVEQAETEAQRQARAVEEEYQQGLRSYQEGKAKLGFPDVEDAEETVTSVLGTQQQNVILLTADNPSLVIYSLAKHPQRLSELSKITNPLKLAAAVAKLEGSLKVTTRKKAPALDTPARGSASVSTGGDKELERLEKEADRTGDRSKLIAYRKKLKAQGK